MPRSHLSRVLAPDAGARGRPDKPALCGLFERHDGSMHCLRIRGIRRAPSRPERAAAVSLPAPVRGVVQVFGPVICAPPLRCMVRVTACSTAPAHACAQCLLSLSGAAGPGTRGGPRVRRRQCCGPGARRQGLLARIGLTGRCGRLTRARARAGCAPGSTRPTAASRAQRRCRRPSSS